MVQVLFSLYLYAGPWLLASFLSGGRACGFFFPGSLFFKLSTAMPGLSWQWRLEADTLKIAVVHYSATIIPLTLWLAFVVSRWCPLPFYGQRVPFMMFCVMDIPHLIHRANSGSVCLAEANEVLMAWSMQVGCSMISLCIGACCMAASSEEMVRHCPSQMPHPSLAYVLPCRWEVSGPLRSWHILSLWQWLSLVPVLGAHLFILYRFAYVSYGWLAIIFSPGLAWIGPATLAMLTHEYLQIVKQRGTCRKEN